MKQKILGTGLNGMVGSRIVDLLSDNFEFENMSRSEGIDITNFQQVEEKIHSSSAQNVLHIAAKADVDACEKDKELGTQGDAWKINVDATKNIAEICKKLGKKVIYISTDFVFDGKNPPKDGYTEEDSPNPIDWYATTKYEGEKAVKNSGADHMIVRISFPFRSSFEQKKDFVRAIMERLHNKQPIAAITDQTITPTFIDDIAQALKVLIEKTNQGIYHVVGSESLTPYNAAKYIAQTFGWDAQLITQTTGGEFFKGRAERPFHLPMSNAKIGKLDVKMKTFTQGLRQVKTSL